MKIRFSDLMPTFLRRLGVPEQDSLVVAHPDEDPDLVIVSETGSSGAQPSPRTNACDPLTEMDGERHTVADDWLFDDDAYFDEARPEPLAECGDPSPTVTIPSDEVVEATTALDVVPSEPVRPQMYAATPLEDIPEDDELEELEDVTDLEPPSDSSFFDALIATEPDADWLVDELPDTDDLDSMEVDDFDFDLPIEDYDRPAPSTELVEPDWRIDRRAAQMIWLLPEVSRAGEAALSELILLLEEFPHGSSHAAIQRLAENGASLEDLTRIAALKRFWSDDSGLWLQRRFDSMTRIWRVQQNVGLRHAMTWRLGLQLVEERDSVEIQDLLSGEWLDEWLALAGDLALLETSERGAFYSFPQFIAQRTEIVVLQDEAAWPYQHPADNSGFRRRFAKYSEANDLLLPDAPSPWTDYGALSRVPVSQRTLDKQ